MNYRTVIAARCYIYLVGVGLDGFPPGCGAGMRASVQDKGTYDQANPVLVVDAKHMGVMHPLPGGQKLEARSRLVNFTPQIERDRGGLWALFVRHSGDSEQWEGA
jgi:hypothetical protein